ncbi:hypothetical protein [Zongyangia hominis]|uniref:DUF2190 domain-containing protein n=1 Tax=Zongyangia hominis TaxID=2763677 RepID=A0A926IBY1_9FIRM|nr:hypothetical protein [Zongyangia hominis]MBC8570540.1 hypothetical protein [Zongyangia hominis]
MTVSFKGLGQVAATFTCGADVAAGQVVSISENGKVTAATAGSDVAGVCQNVRHGLATVIVAGHAQIPYTGEVSLGLASLVGEASGKAKAGEGGRQVLVVASENGVLDAFL